MANSQTIAILYKLNRNAKNNNHAQSRKKQTKEISITQKYKHFISSYL